jgi:hypothetical protein
MTSFWEPMMRRLFFESREVWVLLSTPAAMTAVELAIVTVSGFELGKSFG